MTPIADMVRRLLAKGIGREAIIAAIEAVELTAHEEKLSKREQNRIAKQNQRARHNDLKDIQDIPDIADKKESPSHTLPKEKTTKPNGLAAGAASSEEKGLYERGRKVLGREAGGLIKKLVEAKAGDVALARAALEMASTKADPREYIGGVLRGAADQRDAFWDPQSGIL
jgi:hypothetical protein